MKTWTKTLVLALVMVLAGCGLLPGATPAPGVEPPTGSGGTIVGLALVDNVDALIMESFPVQVRAVVTGDLPDGCTEFGEWMVVRDGDRFVIEIPTVRPADAVCTEALVPFEISVPLEVLGLSAGTYTVDANGVTTTFELAVDNVLSEEPAPGPDLSPCEAAQGEGEVAFTDPAAGTCLRYPEGFTLTMPEAGVVVIHGPDYGSDVEPLTGFVNIQATEPAGGRTPHMILDEIMAAATVEPVSLAIAETTLGGVPAIEVLGIPGRDPSRQVIAAQDDRVVHLVFAPFGEGYAEATADAERLYELVMASFTFLTTSGSGEFPDAAEGARFMLRQVLGTSDVQILNAEATDFPDSCLGLAPEGTACAAVMTPGYIVTLAAGGERYVYHTDQTGGQVLLAVAPPVALESPVLSWQHTFRSECGEAIYALDRAAAGRCGAPMIAAPLQADWLARNLPYLVETYAPFRAETPAGTVVFTGTGSLGALPAEQQMIAEVARIGAGIVESGHAGASYGLAFALHREGGLAGVCEDIEVYVSGEIFITSCAGETPEPLGQGRLTSLELEQLYSLLDTYTFAEYEDDTALAYDGLAIELVFSGRGDVSDTAEVATIAQELAGDAYGRLVFGAVRPSGGPLFLTLPEGWSVGQTYDTVLGTLTVIGETPMDPRSPNSAVYVADASGVSLEHAVKRIFCGPSDCEPTAVLRDVTIAGEPAKRSVPGDGVEIEWFFMSYGGKTITFTVYDPATSATLQEVIDGIWLEAVD
jgi:inhibitor of cysteine peptidase